MDVDADGNGTLSLKAAHKRLADARAAHEKAVRKAAVAEKHLDRFARSLDAAEAEVMAVQQRIDAASRNGASPTV